ncbi:MAG: hypothetical protein GF398_17480 [Chitinivibrionales bacterium]|nr:hypothetical protein [Chitinivibrionales bacterium]
MISALISYGALTGEGLWDPAGMRPWDPDQRGPVDVRRKQVLGSPFTVFGRLPLTDKLAFSASALLFQNVAGIDRDATGICMYVPFGSLETDIGYLESVKQGYPSPALFSATLPSSSLAEVAIYFKLKGPNRVLTGGLHSLLNCIRIAQSALSAGKAEHMLIIAVNALPAEPVDQCLLPAVDGTQCWAYAFLLSKAADRAVAALTIKDGIDPDAGPVNSDYVFLSSLVGMLASGNTGNLALVRETCTLVIEKDR